MVDGEFRQKQTLKPNDKREIITGTRATFVQCPQYCEIVMDTLKLGPKNAALDKFDIRTRQFYKLL